MISRCPAGPYLKYIPYGKKHHAHPSTRRPGRDRPPEQLASMTFTAVLGERLSAEVI